MAGTAGARPLTAIVVGGLLAVAALAFVLAPLFAARSREASAAPDDDAVEALIRKHRADLVSCPTCGPRPEVGARYCSTCGRELEGAGA